MEEGCVAGGWVVCEYLVPDVGAAMPLPLPAGLAEFHFWFAHGWVASEASEASGIGQHGQLGADVRDDRRVDVQDGEFRLLAQVDDR